MKSLRPTKRSATVLIPNEFRSYIESKIHSGQFNSGTEVIAGALKLMRDEERLGDPDLVELRREIAVGLKDLDNGLIEPWDIEALKAEGRRLLASRRSRKR
jgi:antitoxin ParD1/3/4